MANGTGAFRLCSHGTLKEWPVQHISTFSSFAIRIVLLDFTKDHDVVSYSSMISACAQGGQWQLAVHILQTMTERKTLSSSFCPAIFRSRIESCLAENSCNSILEEGQSGTVQLFGEGMTEHVMV